MADSWEDEADAMSGSAALPVIAPATTDKWEGEDEDEVPDAWDAEPPAPAPAAAAAEKKPAAAGAASTKSKKGKKGLAEALDRKKAEAEERRRQTANAADGTEDVGGAASSGLSAEELRRIQEEADLLITKDTFGVNDTPASAPVDPEKSIDLLQPSGKEDFDRLGRLLSQKLRSLEASPHYAAFVESLYRECALDLDPECLRRLSTMFSALAVEKQKMQKPAKGKPKKAKGTLKMERSAAGAIGDEDYDQFDEFDDFM